MQIYGWDFPAICHPPSKFSNHRHRDSGYMFLIRHVTSRNHIFKGLVFISKKNGVNQMECHVHHWSHAQRAKIKETLEKTFAVLSKHTYKKEREEKREKQRLFRSF